MHGRGYLFRPSSHWIGAKVKAERKLVIHHRLQVHDHKILRALTRRFDGELRIASQVKARVAAHGFLEALLVLGGNVGSVVQRNETRVTMLQVEGSDKAVKSQPVDWFFAGK